MYPGLGAKATWPRCFLKRFRESVTDAPGRTGEEEEGRVLDEPLTWSFLHRRTHCCLQARLSSLLVFPWTGLRPAPLEARPSGDEAGALSHRAGKGLPAQATVMLGGRSLQRPSFPSAYYPPQTPRLRSRTRKTPALVKSQGPWHVRAPPAGSPAA